MLLSKTIYSTQQRAYNDILYLPQDYRRETVNHSINFVSLETFAHTPNIEDTGCVQK